MGQAAVFHQGDRWNRAATAGRRPDWRSTAACSRLPSPGTDEPASTTGLP